MTPFNWDHPSLTLSHHVRRVDVPLSVPEWLLPKPKPDFWTSQRYGIFLLTCSWAVAVLLGYWWGS